MKKEDLSKALEDLDSAFENLEVKPLSERDLGRVAGAATVELNGTCAATCNSKCEPTGYWECNSEVCTSTCNYTQVYVNTFCVS